MEAAPVMLVRLLSLVRVANFPVLASNTEPEALLMPKMFWLLAVKRPPKVKALMVRVPVELVIESVLSEDISNVLEEEALPLRVNCPEILAVPSTSKLPDTDAELEKTQKPVIV